MMVRGRAPEGVAADQGHGETRESVAMHDQVLWRDLLAAETPESFGVAWLGLACRVIAGAAGGVLLLNRGGAGTAELVASWPAAGRADAGCLAAAQLAMKEGRGLVQPGAGAQQPLRVAYPIQVDDQVAGAVALDVEQGRDPRDAMRQLQWAAAWVRDYLRRNSAAAEGAGAERTALALDLVAAALDEPSARAACRVAATELASRLDCERVSFGFLVRAESEVVGISHSAQFGKRMNLIRQLAEAMDEAIDQQVVVLFPPAKEEDDVLLRAHAALAAGHGAAFILTVPMFARDRFVGAVTFERAADMPFDQATIDTAEAVASILGPALVDKRANDRPIHRKCIDAAADEIRLLIGPGHIGRKLATAAMVAATLFLAFATGDYRVTASGQVEGVVRRSVVAAFDGFVSEAPVRAGDIVHAGDLIAALDDRDLTLERLRWVTERQQHLYEYDQALSKRERADALKFQSLLDQAEAQTRLVDGQLARARMLAPFDGLVVSGDLTQSIGAAVRRGDVLFEIAPLDNYRVELRVNESQIADVAIGQTGDLVVSALPEAVFPFTVERVTPVAAVRDGGTYFAVDARLSTTSGRLRPGMEGVGKIDVGRRHLSWIWFRSLIHYIEITSWKWLP